MEKDLIGMIAFCSQNRLGLILQNKHTVKYPDGNSAEAYTGIHVKDYPDDDIEMGDPWSSREPRAICSIDFLLKNGAGL